MEMPNIYFIGCDMGGWHTDEENGGDALAICKWEGDELSHVYEVSGRLFYPLEDYSEPAPQGNNATGGGQDTLGGGITVVGRIKNIKDAMNSGTTNPSGSYSDFSKAQILDGLIKAMVAEKAQIVIAVDAALGWPAEFAKLVANASSAPPPPSFRLEEAIKNPYLYRETERFIKGAVLEETDQNPLTAPGDKFGNNSSKAQALVAWFKSQQYSLYRPPFDRWCIARAAQAQYSLVEVYPAASMKCRQFKYSQWPAQGSALPQTMDQVGDRDIADAKRCAMTGVCYAATVGMFGNAEHSYSQVYLPERRHNITYDYTLLPREGWIFCPIADSENSPCQ
jgi:hypothetical protein